MQRGHDLNATPGLIEPQIADDIRNLLATVGAVSRE